MSYFKIDFLSDLFWSVTFGCEQPKILRYRLFIIVALTYDIMHLLLFYNIFKFKYLNSLHKLSRNKINTLIFFF